MAENTPKGHYRVRITVMKQLFHEDMIKRYAGNPET